MYLVKYTIFSTTAANLVPGPLNSHALRVAIRELSEHLFEHNPLAARNGDSD